MNNTLPAGATTAITMEKLYKQDKDREVLLSERMSSRMVKSAAALNEREYLGWQVIVPRKGLVKMTAFGTDSICESDLKWMTEKAAKAKKHSVKGGSIDESLTDLYELYLPVAEKSGAGQTIGFGASPKNTASEFIRWPDYYSMQFSELIAAFQSTGAVLRVVAGYADEEEMADSRKNAIKTYDVSRVNPNDYIGRPVKVRVLLRLPEAPSVRLRSVLEEAVHGSEIRFVGNMNEQKAAEMWNNPISEAPVLPDYAARIMMLEPQLREPIIGIELIEEEAKMIPASHRNPKDKNAVTIGRAVDSTGVKRRMSIGTRDLQRHYQIIGQTGTGKSTLLTTVILSALEKGHGLTFFDPHGSTIDTVLRSVPKEHVGRVRVVRIGDAENPVPFNIWDSDDPEKEERNISDLCELFGDIFDPNREGFVGPRYERWLSTFAKASIAFLGRRASLESIAVLSQSQANMQKLYKAIVREHPELAETIKEEYGRDNSSDFHNLLAWFLCKFQRLTSVEQLRKTLGAGTNALDFANSVDTNTVTLIDLASPVIGTHASRIIGTLMLMKLWSAVLARKRRDLTHIVCVDEAALFQTNPMPRMLAESRKFGVSMVLCHQHLGQLTGEIREALEANSANLSAFRLSAKDAVNAAVRFDDDEMQISLTRLNAFNALTTLSVDGKQTAPFTLETIRPKPRKNGEQIAQAIEKRSRETLVEPYRCMAALTPAEIVGMLNGDEKCIKYPDWVTQWENHREKLRSRWIKKRNDLTDAFLADAV